MLEPISSRLGDPPHKAGTPRETGASIATLLRPEPGAARGARAQRPAGPPWRVTYLVSHPVQSQAPLLAMLAGLPWLDLEVAFRSELSPGDDPDAKFGRSLAREVPLLDGYAHRFLPGSERVLSKLGPRNDGLAELLHRDRTDVLWMHGYSHPVHLAALRLAKRRGLPVFARAESNLIGQPASGFRAVLRRKALTRLLSRLDGLLSIGTANTRFYRHHGVPAEKIHLMPYAVDNARLAQQAVEARVRRSQLARDLGLDPRAPVILFAGELVENKGVTDLLEAFLTCCASPAQSIRPALVLVGSGALEGPLRARARESSGAPVHFAGFRSPSELPRFYDLADLVVVPSRFEPFGLVVNEAMACGSPVLASTAVGAVPDLIAENRTGWTFEAGSTPDLTRRLRDLLFEPRDRAELKRVGEAARERIESWDFEANANGLFHALESL